MYVILISWRRSSIILLSYVLVKWNLYNKKNIVNIA